MTFTQILESISTEATHVSFEAIMTGCCSWHVKIVPNDGSDFLLPTQYGSQGEAKEFVKQLTTAYKIGMKMKTVNLINKLEKQL